MKASGARPDESTGWIPLALGFVTFFLVANLSESWLWLGNELLVVLFVYVVVRTNAEFLAATSAIRMNSLRPVEAACTGTFQSVLVSKE